MREYESRQEGLFGYVPAAAHVPADHRLQGTWAYGEQALRRMSRVFNRIYADGGRQSVPRQTLRNSALLMVLYTVRSERLFCEMLQHNLRFRWFLAVGIDAAVFDHCTFSNNRERLLANWVAQRFLGMIVRIARSKGFMSHEHFIQSGRHVD